MIGAFTVRDGDHCRSIKVVRSFCAWIGAIARKFCGFGEGF
jgi:hypothetical protein